MTPQRIQRRRTKGWRAPLDENGLPPISVTRPGPFGNPFTVNNNRSATTAVANFRNWLDGETDQTPELRARRAEILRRLPELRGRNLMCFCPLESSCHADVLLRLANKEKL